MQRTSTAILAAAIAALTLSAWQEPKKTEQTLGPSLVLPPPPPREDPNEFRVRSGETSRMERFRTQSCPQYFGTGKIVSSVQKDSLAVGSAHEL